jgi:hypothetical protein
MDIAEPPPPPKPRTPAAVIAAVALLWLLTIATAWTAAIATVATAFEVTARYAGPLSPLEFIEPLLITAVAALTGLLAVKVWSGRDWARRTVVIATAIALTAAIFTRVAFMAGTGTAGAIIFTLVLLLLLLRPARDWCDSEAPRHSPRIDTAAQPPYLVVAALLVLWTAVGISLYIGTSVLLGLAEDDAVTADSMAWAAGAIVALAVVHAALNIAFSYHRNWARWTTIALTAAYALWLVVAAVIDLFSEGTGPWLVPALLCLVPLALAWAMLNEESRAWCRREEA